MQFYTFIKKIDKILSSFSTGGNNNNDFSNLSLFETQPTGSVQQNLFTQAIKETVADIPFEYQAVQEAEADKIINELTKSERLALKVYSKNDLITGISVSNGKSYYFPAEIVPKLKNIIENPEIKILGYDAKSDFRTLMDNGYEPAGLEYVKDPNRRHDLDSQALDFLKHIMTEDDDDDFVKFACDEAYSIFRLYDVWQKKLKEKEQELVVEIEIPLTIVLAKMEHTGVTIDVEYLKDLSAYMTEKLAELEDIIYQLAGGPFNINSPKQVAEVLFDKLEIKTKKKKSRSTGAEVLEELAEEYEICEYILQHRKFSKLKSTYVDVLPTLISKRDGRLHTTYNQALTVTGRLSSSNPNLQNIPIRTEEGNKIRAAFCAADKENSLIMSADYSQIELRLLAHVSGDMHLIKAFNSGEDIHAITASKVFGVKLEKVTKEMRRRAKAVNFGIVYGQSKYGLAKNLGITNNEAQEFIDKYFKTYPGVKEYMNEEVEFVNKKGYVETIFGRKRYLSAELNSSTYSIREFAQRAAINQPLQGTAADLIKMAMVKVERELEAKNLKTKMIMQVHDELVFEVPKEELEIVKELVMRCMELKNIPLRVPLVVDVNCGPTWKEV